MLCRSFLNFCSIWQGISHKVLSFQSAGLLGQGEVNLWRIMRVDGNTPQAATVTTVTKWWQYFLTIIHLTSETLRGDVRIHTYKPHTNHKKPSVRSHTLASTTTCDLSHSVCGSPLTDLGDISSVTYVCHPLWFVGGHRKGILTSPLTWKYCSLVIWNAFPTILRNVTMVSRL